MKIISRLTSLLLSLTCLVACTRPATVATNDPEPPACCQGHYPAATLRQYSPRQLGREYQRLKRAHCPACSRYGSDLQKVMNELSAQLSGQSGAAIRQAMGRPDEATDSTLIYHWRYRHDYLRFRLAPNGTAVSSWYYAYE